MAEIQTDILTVYDRDCCYRNGFLSVTFDVDREVGVVTVGGAPHG